MMNTVGPPSTDVSAARRWISRTVASGWLAIPSGDPYSGFFRRSAMISPISSAASSTCLSLSAALGRRIGTIQCRSACPSPFTRRQGRHAPHGSALFFSQRSSCASHSASRCRPVPSAPSNRST